MQYIESKRVCFGIKLYKLISSNGTTLSFSVNRRKRMFHIMGMKIAPEQRPLYQIFFFLLVTPDISPVLVTMIQSKDYHL